MKNLEEICRDIVDAPDNVIEANGVGHGDAVELFDEILTQLESEAATINHQRTLLAIQTLREEFSI